MSLFEMWNTDLAEETLEQFRVFKTEYEPPAS